MDKISNDRITDRADQIPLLLNREGHSPRNFMAHYPGGKLGCEPLRGCKVHIKAVHGALPSMDFDNIKREPGGKMRRSIWRPLRGVSDPVGHVPRHGSRTEVAAPQAGGSRGGADHATQLRSG